MNELLEEVTELFSYRVGWRLIWVAMAAAGWLSGGLITGSPNVEASIAAATMTFVMGRPK